VHNDSSLSLVALDGNQVVGFILSEIMTNSFGLDQSGWIKIIGVHLTGEGFFELSACSP
jgi:hypothetical protein